MTFRPGERFFRMGGAQANAMSGICNNAVRNLLFYRGVLVRESRRKAAGNLSAEQREVRIRYNGSFNRESFESSRAKIL